MAQNNRNKAVMMPIAITNPVVTRLLVRPGSSEVSQFERGDGCDDTKGPELSSSANSLSSFKDVLMSCRRCEDWFVVQQEVLEDE